MLKEIYKNDKLTIYEQPPIQRSIVCRDSGERKIFFLKFPYLAFVITNDFYKSLYVFASNKPITLDSIIGRSPFPNIDKSGKVCIGTVNLKFTNEDIINKFWLSAFNTPETSFYIVTDNFFKLLKNKDPLSLKWNEFDKLKNHLTYLFGNY